MRDRRRGEGIDCNRERRQGSAREGKLTDRKRGEGLDSTKREEDREVREKGS